MMQYGPSKGFQPLREWIADWQGVEKMGEMFQQHTGRVLTTTAPAPHASRP